MIILDSRSIYLGDYPCSECLIQAACSNYACPMVEKYLTKYHNCKGIASADELKQYAEKVPPMLKDIMDRFEKNKKFVEDKYRSSFLFSVSDIIYEISLFKGKIEIEQKKSTLNAKPLRTIRFKPG